MLGAMRVVESCKGVCFLLRNLGPFTENQRSQTRTHARALVRCWWWYAALYDVMDIGNSSFKNGTEFYPYMVLPPIQIIVTDLVQWIWGSRIVSTQNTHLYSCNGSANFFGVEKVLEAIGWFNLFLSLCVFSTRFSSFSWGFFLVIPYPIICFSYLMLSHIFIHEH